VSQRPSRRPAPVPAVEPEASFSWGRQTWIAIVVMAALIAAVIGAGWLVQKTLEPPVPAALAHCDTSTQIGPHQFIGPQPMCITDKQILDATIATAHGDIVIRLAPEVAPVTVNNFVVLAIHGYYNGLSFWKAEDWVVQSGDPLGNGRGGPGYNLPEETTTTAWGEAAVGMARVPGGPVNGSQFFIQKSGWPGSGPTVPYNRFGTVTSGMANVGTIVAGDTITSITITVSQGKG
jgi:cyclophilin family peptidyl-prolyl cis-trans isomerase